MSEAVNAAFRIETFLDGTRTDSERMAELVRSGEFLVAEDDSGLTACVYTECRGERGYFGMLAVRPDRQGTGLGRALVRAAEDHCRKKGCTLMEISVLALRAELSPFYQRPGYALFRTEPARLSRSLKPGFKREILILAKPLQRPPSGGRVLL